MAEGVLEGQGVLSWPDGQRYEGAFKAGHQEGHGVLTFLSGHRYVGEFSKGKRHGRGVQTSKAGHRYEGDFANDMLGGQGILVFPDGGRYEGGFLDDKMAGVGVRIFANGQRYEGGFLNDLFSGKGIQTWPSGHRYEGEYVAGHRQGYGHMRYPGGHYYVGQWVNNERQGPIQDVSARSSTDSSQLIAGAIGLGIIGSASGLSSAEKVRIASGFVADVATDGKGQNIQSAVTGVRDARIQSAEIQAVIQKQQQLAQQRQAAQQPVAAQPPIAAQQPVAALASKPVAAAPSADFDALLRAAPKTEKYAFSCGAAFGYEMIAAEQPGSCIAEQKRYMLIQCFPGWLSDESYVSYLKCGAEKSTGKYKAEHENKLRAHRDWLRQVGSRCAPDGCSGRAHLGSN
jgi:hypothetical protein